VQQVLDSRIWPHTASQAQLTHKQERQEGCRTHTLMASHNLFHQNNKLEVAYQ
jgi:hypothetical protein